MVLLVVLKVDVDYSLDVDFSVDVDVEVDEFGDDVDVGDASLMWMISRC